MAGEELGRLLRDPAFGDPTSETAKAGAIYSRLAHRAAALVLQVGRQLGFTPAGRQALGIGVREEKPVPDIWANELRLIRGGKGEPPERKED